MEQVRVLVVVAATLTTAMTDGAAGRCQGFILLWQLADWVDVCAERSVS